MGWVRPENVSYPKVWTTFLAKDLDSDNLVEYRVQDLPEDRFEDTVKYLLENYLNDEPFTSSKDLQDDPEALEEQMNFWRNHFKSKTTLVCFKEGSDEIVGVNLTAIVLEEDKDKPIEIKTKKIQELIGAFIFIGSQVDVYKKYKIDKYLTAYGLSVCKKYRGRGISTEILRARIPFCQAFGVKVTCTIFTATISQKSASKVGFHEIFGITQAEMLKESSDYYFKNFTADKCRVMDLQIPEV